MYAVTVISLMTGTAVFVFGMLMIKYCLDESFSERSAVLLKKCTSNRFTATLTGTVITVALQSSSASSVLTAAFVDSGVLSLYSAFWLIVGANMGTTFTGLLTAASFTELAPLSAVAGIALISLTKARRLNRTGLILTGFGLLFVGMNMMEGSAQGLKEMPFVVSVLANSKNAFSGILLGCFFTALIQSSSATTALLQAMAAGGLIGLEQVFYIILGANIGTCFTCAVSSLSLRDGAKKVSLMHIAYNLVGSVLFALGARFIPFAELVRQLAPSGIKAQTALINIIFNAFCAAAALLLPIRRGKGFTIDNACAKIKEIISRGNVKMKKAISLLLSAVLLFSLTAQCFAAGEEPLPETAVNEITAVETDTPVIVVRGMNFAGGLQFDRGTENAAPANVQFDAGELFSYLAKTVAAVITTFSISAGVSVVCEYIVKLFSAYPCDKNGNSVHTNISAEYYPESVAHYPELLDTNANDEISLVTSLAARYGSDKVYYFVYDWRLDPMDNADLLNETVEKALADHSAEKVDIICCSMGGSITMAYMAEYGYEKLDTVVSNTSVMFGADVITDLFRGKVSFEADAVERYLSQMVPSLAGLLKVANVTGALDGLCKFINSFAAKYEDQIFEETLIPTFATLPGFWSMMKGECYPEAREFIFDGREEQYAGLLSRLDNFYNSVSSRRQELLDGALASGVKLAVVASYGLASVPAYEHAKYQADGVVETAPMSGGALTSVVGSTLTEQQLAVGDSKYVSADKCINASTCMYRDYTWFVKDAGHVLGLYGSDCSLFLFALLESETQPTIASFPEYPQFMLSDSAETLAPLV